MKLSGLQPQKRSDFFCVCVCVCARAHAQSLNCVWPFAIPWTVVHQAPLSMGFSRQEYWNGLPFPPPRDLPNPRKEPKYSMSPELAGRFFTTEPPVLKSFRPWVKQTYVWISAPPLTDWANLTTLLPSLSDFNLKMRRFVFTYKTDTYRLREWTYDGCQGQGEEWEDGIVREFGMDMYRLLYLKWIINKDLLYSTENSAQCYMAAWMGGGLGRERIHVYV